MPYCRLLSIHLLDECSIRLKFVFICELNVYLVHPKYMKLYKGAQSNQLILLIWLSIELTVTVTRLTVYWFTRCMRGLFLHLEIKMSNDVRFTKRNIHYLNDKYLNRVDRIKWLKSWQYFVNEEQIISGCPIDGAISVPVDDGFGSYRWFVYITLLLRDASWILILHCERPEPPQRHLYC